MEKLKQKLEKFKRQSAKPLTQKGDGTLDSSKYGGKPWLNSGEKYPVCPNCLNPMPLFLQLNLNEIPETFNRKFGAGILQFFYCIHTRWIDHDTGFIVKNSEEYERLIEDSHQLIIESVKEKLTKSPSGLNVKEIDGVEKIVVNELIEHCEGECNGGEPFSECQLVRIIQPLYPCADYIIPFIENQLDPKHIIDWENTSDYPNWHEWLELSILSEEEQDLADENLHKYGDKLTGWPSWVQGPQMPDCPICNCEMEQLVFQIESEENIDYMWGDAGTGYIVQCLQHKDQVTFFWQCH